MNEPENPMREELADRLMDRALGEVLGGETPPDLSERIVAAVQTPDCVSPIRKEGVMDKPKRKGNRIVVAVAACVAVVILVGLLMPAVNSVREAGRRSAPNGELAHEPFARSWSGTYEAAEQSAPGTEPSAPSMTYDMPAAERAPSAATASYDGRFAPAAETTEELSLFLPGGTADPAYGRGPGRGGDRYDVLVENPFRLVKDAPLSTFSIDVDTASYANVRRFILGDGRLPPPDAVRIEELINYFHYDYEGPKDEHPFAVHLAAAECPWKPDHKLVRVALKGREIPDEERPECNLVFLVDVSGSMDQPDKLPLVVRGLKMLAEQMRDQDRVAIVVYASAEGLVLPSTPGTRRKDVLDVLDRLQAGGSTNGGAGIALAYRIAKENFIPGGVNRVLLCTDGDFNVGTTSTGDLVRLVEEKAREGVFLSVFGFGRGNLNDAMMENISNKGNGNYAYIDGDMEARKVFVEQLGGTLVTIAKDVKIQVEFNPARVAAYRLIGYENRILATEDFNDDKKDAGEVGAGHTVTALYEIVPVGAEIDVPPVDPLKYQSPTQPRAEAAGDQAGDDGTTFADELLTVKLRYKQPDGETSTRLEFPLADEAAPLARADHDFQFTAAVASFGMLLRGSQHKGDATFDAVLEIASAAKGHDAYGYRAEFLEIVRRAKALAGR